MKKDLLISFCLAALAAALFSCKEKEEPAVPPVNEPDAPEVSLSRVDSTLTSITFLIEATDAEYASYMVIGAHDDIPSAETVLSEGKTIMAEDSTIGEKVEYFGLETAEQYVVVAAAANGELVSGPVTLTMSTVSDYYADFNAEWPTLWYYGPQDGTAVDMFFLQLSTAEADVMASPLEGGKLIRLYLYTESTGGDLQLVPGTYTLGAEGAYEKFTIDPSTSVYATGTTADDWTQVYFESGTLEVTAEGDGYYLKADMVIADGESSKVRARFEGIIATGDISSGYLDFNSEVEQTMTGLSGRVRASSSAPGLSNASVTLYNCVLDSDGYVVGPGYLFNMELYMPTNDEGIYDGEYEANPDWGDAVYPEYTYITGFLYDMFGMVVPQGTYVSEYYDNGSLIRVGVIVSGTITVRQEGGHISITTECLTDRGVPVRITYDGDDIPLVQTGAESLPCTEGNGVEAGLMPAPFPTFGCIG